MVAIGRFLVQYQLFFYFSVQIFNFAADFAQINLCKIISSPLMMRAMLTNPPTGFKLYEIVG
jgi:hypothetical protein